MTTERPIIFNGDMVRALLDGRKSQTRRIVKGASDFPLIESFQPWIVDGEPQARASGISLWYSREVDGTCREWGCPYPVGSRLYVKETFGYVPGGVEYRATVTPEMEPSVAKWRSSMFMPRALARLTLEVCSVSVQRVGDIREEDAEEEGIERTSLGFRDYELPANVMHGVPAVYSFQTLWDSIHAKRPGCTWEANPFCWVISFRRIDNALA